MKKRFISKSLIAKIALVLVIILLFEFSVSEPVHAASLGGQLLNPVVNLVVYLADGVLSILQGALTKIDTTFNYIDITGQKKSWWVALGAIGLGILLVAGAVALSVVTAGAAVPAIVGSIAGTAATGLAGAGLTAALAGGVYLAVYPRFGEKIDAVVFGNSFVYSNIYITPETILKNQIQLFNVNYFETIADSDVDDTVSLSNTLRKVVSQAYTTIRDIALVAMLIVIIYIAIRMLLALTPKEKSRYKESAVNCIIGVILIVLMHYIMSISVTGLEMITNSISITNQVYSISESEVNNFLASNQDAYNNAISGVSLEIVGDQLYDAVEDPDSSGTSMYEGIILQNNGGDKTAYVKASNFTEQARYMAQKLYTLNDEDETVETWEHIGWAFVYIMLVILTLAFVLMYTKRTLYMAALTMFAPIVGVMYPINRANGSRAQTLNLWFKEYIGNLVIQPMHLFLYTIFIGSAMAMAINNPVYVIIAIMGLVFVENLLKDLLGIQDTRMGGLGRSLQDTVRAIKTTERATTKVARDVGRAVSRGTHALGTGIVAGTGYVAARKKQGSGTEETENGEETITAPRVQQPPALSGANNQTPSIASAQDPLALGDSLNSNPAQQLQIEQQAQQQTQQQAQPVRLEKPQSGRIDEAATMRNYMNAGFGENAYGHYFNPRTNMFDPNYNPLEDPEFQVFKDFGRSPAIPINEAETMKNYMNAGFGQNANGHYFNPKTGKYDPTYNPLEDENFQVLKGTDEPQGKQLPAEIGMQNMDARYEQNTNGKYINPNIIDLDDSNALGENRNIGVNVREDPAGILDSDTISMVNNLNGNRDTFSVINGTGGENRETIVRTDGERNVYQNNDDNSLYRLERTNGSNGKDPMAMQMAAGGDNSSYMNNESGGIPRSIVDIDTLIEDKADFTNSTSASNNLGARSSNNSGTRAYGSSGGSRSVLDRNNSNTSFSDTSSNIRNEWEVLDGGLSNNANIGMMNDAQSDISANSGNVRIDKSSGNSDASVRTNSRGRKTTSSRTSGTNTIQIDNENSNTNSSQDIPRLDSSEYEVIQPENQTISIDNNTNTQNNSSSRNNTTSRSSSRRTKNASVNVDTDSQQFHRLTSDEYDIIPPGVDINIGSESGSTSTRTNTRSSESSRESTTRRTNKVNLEKPTRAENTQRENTATSDYSNNTTSGSSVDSNNNAQSTTSSNNTSTESGSQGNNSNYQVLEKVVRGVQKGMDVAGTAMDRTTGVVGAATEGVIDAALNAVSGNPAGTAGAVAGAATGVVGAVTGAPRRTSGSSSSSKSTSSSQSNSRQDPKEQTIINAGLSEQDAKAVKNACERYGINDDRNMAEIGKVWKKVSAGDKGKIFEISYTLIQLKVNSGSQDDADRLINTYDIGSSTKSALSKMYDKLHR